MKYTLYTLTDHALTAQEVIAPEHDGFLLGTVHLEEQSRHASQYARGIRAAVRGLWNGTFDINQSFDAFFVTVNNGLTRAWYAGAAGCGITPAEMTPEERTTLAQIIANEQRYIFPFLLEVEAGSKAEGGKWGAFKGRLETWGLRYDDVKSRGQLMACADRKYRWTLNVTRNVKENCNTCKNKLAGKVKRGSYWNRAGVRPQDPPNSNLDCGGWKCGCGLVETDEPLSRGPLPRLP